MTGINWTGAVAGGLMIGSAAALFFWLNGRIAGVSSIFGDLMLERGQGHSRWRLLFLLGLVLGCLLVRQLSPEFAQIELQTGWLGLVIAGLLVGYGTRLGSGCTSGHGICGLARFSTRSLVATVLFMVTAIATVAVLRALGGGA
jgi:hypothetical protein